MTDETYRSQFRLPYSLFERLKASSDKNRRSLNAELVCLLETYVDIGEKALYAERQRWKRLRLEACIEVLDAEIVRAGDPVYSSIYNLEKDEWKRIVEARWAELGAMRSGLQSLLEEARVQEEQESHLRTNRFFDSYCSELSSKKPDARRMEIVGELQRINEEQSKLLEELAGIQI